MKSKTKVHRNNVPKDRVKNVAYSQLWKVVDGAVRDTLNSHPDYVADQGARRWMVRRSLCKRVVGAVMGFAAQAAQGR